MRGCVSAEDIPVSHVQVKTRLQSEGKHTTADRRYNGSLDAVTRIWQEEGARPQPTHASAMRPFRSGTMLFCRRACMRW